MAFRLPYECEYCGYTIKCRKQDLPQTCPKCENEPIRIVDVDCSYCQRNLPPYIIKTCVKQALNQPQAL